MKNICLMIFGLFAVVDLVHADTLPAVSSANLILDMDASTGVTTNASGVTSVADQSGNGNTAFQTNSAEEPTLVPDAINGNAAIGFNGTSSYLNLTNELDLTSGTSIYIVAKNTANAYGLDGLFVVGTSSTTPQYDNGLLSLYYDSSNDINLVVNYVSYPTGYNVVQANSAVPATNSPFFLGYTSSTTNDTYRLSLNGQSINPGTGGLTTAAGSYLPINNAGYGIIGSVDAGGGVDFTGDIAQVLVYQGALSTADQSAVETYLDDRYLLASVPEPASLHMLLLALGMLLLVTYVRRVTHRV